MKQEIPCVNCKHCLSLKIKDGVVECKIKEVDYIPDYCGERTEGVISDFLGLFK